MTRSYTREEIARMRKIVATELLDDVNAQRAIDGNLLYASLGYLSEASIEERLRTYILAGAAPEEFGE